jgi:hypothetical protein
VTEELVPKGTLLLSSKAYAIGFVRYEDNTCTTMSQSLNVIKKMAAIKQRSHMLCMLETIQKLKREPQTAKELYGLYAGDEFDRQNVPMEGIIDTSRINRICILNGCEPMDDRKVHFFHILLEI